MVEGPVEPLDGSGTVDRPTHRRREYQAGLVPLGSGGKLVLNLVSAVLGQGAERSRRQVDRASAACRVAYLNKLSACGGEALRSTGSAGLRSAG
jgi:hypothetical protein